MCYYETLEKSYIYALVVLSKLVYCRSQTSIKVVMVSFVVRGIQKGYMF